MLNYFSILFDQSRMGNFSDMRISLGDFNTLEECVKAAKLYTKQNKQFEKLAYDDFFEISHFFKVIQYKPYPGDIIDIKEPLAIVSLDLILEDNPSDLSSYTFIQ